MVCLAEKKQLIYTSMDTILPPKKEQLHLPEFTSNDLVGLSSRQYIS